MWCSCCTLLAIVVQVASTASIPCAEDDAPEVPRAFIGPEEDGLAPSNVTDFIAPTLPLEDFGSFDSFTLEEILEKPELLDANARHKTHGESPDDSALKRPAVEGEFLSTAATAARCTNPSIRVEWRKYSASDRKAFVNSILCLTKLPSAGKAHSPSTSRYEDLVRSHQRLTNKIHGNNLFLLWHRKFLATFEEALRSQCGFDRALPWWDETLDSGAFHKSSLFSRQYFGTLAGPTNGAGTCVTDGVFANMVCHLGPGTSNTKHCLSRAVNEREAAQATQAYVNYCARFTDFVAFSRCAETGPHASVHNGIGAVMCVLPSPSQNSCACDLLRF